MQVLFEWPAQWDTCVAVLSMVFKVCFEFEFEMCSQKKVSRGNFQLHSVSVAQCTRMYVCMYVHGAASNCRQTRVKSEGEDEFSD